MPGRLGSSAWRRRVCLALLAVCALMLAGCATGYRYVQPNASGSGGYYTSSGPYSGAGYYDAYGTGPYYAGTSGWGYYNGSSPYVGVYGGYSSYPGWGYWPGFGFGVSGIWNFPGYWGPWYGGYPRYWRHCRQRHCDNHHGGHHGPDNPQDLGVVSVRPMLLSGHAVDPQDVRKVELPNDFQPRNAGPWLRERAAIDHERFVRAPLQRNNIAPRPLDLQDAATPAPRPPARFTPVRRTNDLVPSRNGSFQPAPRSTPRPAFQPRAAAPERQAAPRPRGNHSPDVRRH